MLVLSRATGEALQIGDTMTLAVIRIHADNSVTFRLTTGNGLEATHETRSLPCEEWWEIQPNIRILILNIRPGSTAKARLAIECPADIPLHRREVYEAILREMNHPAE